MFFYAFPSLIIEQLKINDAQLLSMLSIFPPSFVQPNDVVLISDADFFLVC